MVLKCQRHDTHALRAKVLGVLQISGIGNALREVVDAALAKQFKTNGGVATSNVGTSRDGRLTLRTSRRGASCSLARQNDAATPTERDNRDRQSHVFLRELHLRAMISRIMNSPNDM